MSSRTVTKTWLTPEAADRLRAEEQEILHVRLPAVEDALAEAQSSGALIDNGDLDAALSERAMLEARLSQIRTTLSSAVVRSSSATLAGMAGVGNVVTVEFEDGSTDTFLFADPSNKVPGYVVLSPHSPLGKALLGAAVGTKVSYETPAGTQTVVLRAVEALS